MRWIRSTGRMYFGMKRFSFVADEVDQVYWKNVLWNESYFIASCGGVKVSVLRKDIENQDPPDK
jgi:REP element-mobilizing transposase RayT